MSGYADVDEIIAAWVRLTNSTLFTEWAGAPARYFHLPGDPPFECFQISISSPEGLRTTVAARAIDTNDNTEARMDQTWEGPVEDLDEMIGAAVAAIEKWRVRAREAPDPPSPW